MGKLDSYKIELKGLSDGVYEYYFHLDDKFFSEVNGPEVQRGDVNVHLLLRKVEESFKLDFSLSGVVIVPCDRCLDDMEYCIDSETELTIKYGTDTIDEGDKLIIAEGSNEVDLSWYLYEFVALELPLQHTHPEGECNAEMDSLLQQHSGMLDDEAESEGAEPVDSRWNELKKLIDNN